MLTFVWYRVLTTESHLCVMRESTNESWVFNTLVGQHSAIGILIAYEHLASADGCYYLAPRANFDLWLFCYFGALAFPFFVYLTFGARSQPGADQADPRGTRIFCPYSKYRGDPWDPLERLNAAHEDRITEGPPRWPINIRPCTAVDCIFNLPWIALRARNPWYETSPVTWTWVSWIEIQLLYFTCYHYIVLGHTGGPRAGGI